MQQPLQLVVELVRAEHAQVAQPGRPAGQRRIGELGIQHGVVDPVQLQREEQQVRTDGRDPLAGGLVELGRGGVGAVGAEQQLSVGHDPAQHLLDLLVLGERRRELRAAEVGEPAGIGGAERPSVGVSLLEAGGNLVAVRSGVEIGKVPGGKRPGRIRGGASESVGRAVKAGSRHLVLVLSC